MSKKPTEENPAPQDSASAAQGDGDCGIPNDCTRVVPGWLIALDNAPTQAMFLLGAAIIWPLTPLGAILYLAYCELSIVMFWRLICPYCHHYATRACPCGYGVLAAKFFQRRPGPEFKQIFKQRIAVVFPDWLIPFGAGAWRLWTAYTPGLLALFAAFCVVGFILIPLISKTIGCKDCEIRDQCPWMT